MQAAIEPMLRIPLRAERDGATWNPRLDIIPSGPTLVIEQPGTEHSLFQAVIWHAPSAAALVLLACIVLLCRAALRLLSRPQRPGLIYCRRCSYELVEPIAGYGEDGKPRWLGSVGRCPECGSLAKPVVGRDRLGRALWPVFLLGAPAFVCVVVLALTLQPLGPFGAPAWPFPAAGRVLGRLSVQRRPWNWAEAHRLFLWGLPERKDLGVLGPFLVYGMDNSTLSADGRWFVYVSEPSKTPGWSMPVVVADLESGRQLLALFEAEPGVTRSMVGPSPDGAEVYIQTYHYGSGPTYHETLEAVNVRTARVTQIADLTSTYAGGAAGARVATNRRFVVGPRRRWSALQWGGGAAPVQITVPQEAGHRTFSVSLPAFSNLNAWPGPSGSIEVALWPVGATWRIDPATDSAAALPSAPGTPLGRSRDGRYEVRSRPPILAVIDTASGATVATLAVSGGTPGSGAVVSADGRWVACEVGIAGGQSVFAWDLAPK